MRIVVSMLVGLTLASLARPVRGDDDSPYQQQAVRPERDGFTMELGFGVGHTYVPLLAGSEHKLGVAPLSMSLGWFFTNKLAVLARMTSAIYFQAGTITFSDGSEEDELLRGGLLLLGAHVQYWFNDWLFVSGGPAMAMHSLLERELGFGMAVRVGVSAVTWKNHSLGFSLEALPSYVAEDFFIAETLKLEWQWF